MKTLKTGVTTNEVLNDGIKRIEVNSPYFVDEQPQSWVTMNLTQLFKNLYK